MTTSAPRPSVAAFTCRVEPAHVGDDDVGAAALRQGETIRVEIRRDHRRGADRPRQLDVKVADRPRADHQHAFAETDPALLGGPDRAGERFRQGRDLERHVVRNRNDQALRNFDVFGKGPVDMDTELPHLGAVQDLVLAAIEAVAAADVDVGDHALADRHGRDRVTEPWPPCR